MTQTCPDLSIVIVNWNTLDLLQDVLSSIYDNDTGLPMQVIVVDNASVDGSAEMVEAEFPQVELIRNDENRGFAAANNQGFEIATGRYILLLNSDTIVLGDVLRASVAYLDTNPAVGAMGCRVLNTDRTVQHTCSRWPSLLNLTLQSTGLWKLPWPKFFGRFLMTDWQRDSERTVESITGCYLMLRREVMEEVGVLDEDFFFFGEETDWCRRMRDAGWKLNFAPVGEIIHHGSASAKKLNHKRDLLLTDALVRLHLKHDGRISAALVWLALLLHNLSRAIMWRLRLLLRRDKRSLERARHFSKVTVGQVKDSLSK